MAGGLNFDPKTGLFFGPRGEVVDPGTSYADSSVPGASQGNPNVQLDAQPFANAMQPAIDKNVQTAEKEMTEAEKAQEQRRRKAQAAEVAAKKAELANVQARQKAEEIEPEPEMDPALLEDALGRDQEMAFSEGTTFADAGGGFQEVQPEEMTFSEGTTFADTGSGFREVQPEMTFSEGTTFADTGSGFREVQPGQDSPIDPYADRPIDPYAGVPEPGPLGMDRGLYEAQAPGFQMQAEGMQTQADAEAKFQGSQAKQVEEEADATLEAIGQADEEIDKLQTKVDARQAIAERQAEVARKVGVLSSTDIEPPSPSVLNLIGVAMGGLLSPLMGGRNLGLEALNKRIDREVETELANRKQKMQALQYQGGELSREDATLQSMISQKEILTARKLQGAINAAKAQAASANIGPTQQAAAEKFLGELQERLGAEKTAAEQREIATDLKKAALALKAAKKGGGTGAGKGLVRRAERSPLYYDVATGNTLDISQDKKVKTNLLAVIPIVNTETDEVLRGLKFLDPKQATAVRKAWADRNQVRLGVQRLKRYYDLAKEKGGWADTLTLAGAAKTREGAKFRAEFTELMVALKDQWELGAIQKPDERLMEGAMGLNPTEAWGFIADKMSLNQFESVINNMQSRGGLKLKTSILSEAGLPDKFEIQMPAFDATSDIDEEARVQPATGEVATLGNAAAAKRVGDAKEYGKRLRTALGQETAGLKKSAQPDSGGVVARQAPGIKVFRETFDEDPKMAFQAQEAWINHFKENGTKILSNGDKDRQFYDEAVRRIKARAPEVVWGGSVLDKSVGRKEVVKEMRRMFRAK